ncbi:hypothetical protein NQZ68_032232 [Dissostichus eleginoides]|nr:hypothetical protein NQZ68_032232 [Dissostichus eleginoides]
MDTTPPPSLWANTSLLSLGPTKPLNNRRSVLGRALKSPQREFPHRLTDAITGPHIAEAPYCTSALTKP